MHLDECCFLISGALAAARKQLRLQAFFEPYNGDKVGPKLTLHDAQDGSICDSCRCRDRANAPIAYGLSEPSSEDPCCL